MFSSPLYLAAFLLTSCTIGQTGTSLAPRQPDPSAEPGRLERFDSIASYLQARQAAEFIPGLSCAIAVDGRMVFSRAFGRSDIENNVAATPKTVYRIASISTWITAIAVLQLVQDGKIALNTSVRDFVPELPDKGHRITVEHILPHLSGIRPINSREELYNTTHFTRLTDTLDSFKDDPLVAPPAARFLYTPLAYNLLGLMVERVSGLSFGDYLKRRIFEPAGMSSAGLDDPARVIPHRARGYLRKKDNTLRNARFADTSLFAPANGMIATAEDLAKLAVALESDVLLEPAMRQLMMTEYKTASGKATRYGLGCFVRTLDGKTIVGHGGWQPQVSSFLLAIPEDRIVIALLANLEQADVRAMSLNIARILLETPAGSLPAVATPQ